MTQTKLATDAVPAHTHAPLGPVRARFKLLLMRVVLIGPVAALIADRIAHALGFCLGF